jgi:hypothetical protein
MKTEKDIDKIFKHRLEAPVDETGFREADWDNLQQMLDQDKKRPGIIFWLPYLSSAAAVLLFLGWWMFRPQAAVQQKAHQEAAVKPVQKLKQDLAGARQEKGNNTNNTSPQLDAADKTVKPAQRQPGKPEYLANNSTLSNRPVNSKSIYNKTRSVNMQDKSNPVNGQISDNNKQNDIIMNDNTRDNEILSAMAPIANVSSTYSTGKPVLASADVLSQPAINSTDNDASKAGKASIKKTGTGYHPQFTLSFIGASEANGVGSLQQTSSGENFGIMFSAGLIKKFTVSTGVNYSLKPYTLPFADYHTAYKFKNAPEYVTADCRVLDIPLNIDYQVYSKHRNKISVGAGMSSYIMMHESYTYDYGDADVLYGPSYYAVKTRGEYFFSIMNLQATYQRQINAKVGISFQPYLKLPLTNIGYSQIKVETAGMAIGLNWNINALTKPK